MKALLLLVLVFGMILLFTKTSYALEDTGSIQLSVYYSNGDRANSYGQTLKIYQDNNETAYKVIIPNSYPFTIDSLPLNHKYKIEVYNYSMFASSSDIDLKNVLEKVVLTIPLDVGVRFNVFYKDAQTPIEKASVSLKSYDGIEWITGVTDDKGNSARFWIPSTIKQDNYYIASFSIGRNLTYTYPTPINLGPGQNSDFKIVTPWPQFVEQLIIVTVYKSPFQTVQKSDGDFLAELTDENGNKTAQSSVDSHGLGYFSNVKLGNYVIHVLKTSENFTSAVEVGSKNLVLTANPAPIDIYLLDTKKAEPLTKINETKSQSPKKIQSCQCVIFRLDTVQDYFVRDSSLAVLNLFVSKNQPLTLGIIAKSFGDDTEIVETVKEGIKKNLFQPALNGYNYTDYTTLSTFDQTNSLNLTNQKMEKLFGNTTDIFIPPYNRFNDDTLESLEKLGIKIISGESELDSNIYHYTKDKNTVDPRGIYHIPQVLIQPYAGSKEIQYFSSSSSQEVLDDVNFSLENYGYAVIGLLPQDFAKTTDGNLVDTNIGVNYTKIESLSGLMDKLTSQNIKITTFHDLIGLKPIIFENQNPETRSAATVPEFNLTTPSVLSIAIFILLVVIILIPSSKELGINKF